LRQEDLAEPEGSEDAYCQGALGQEVQRCSRRASRLVGAEAGVLALQAGLVRKQQEGG
jgi:hypothetical protein